ncbi:hypothetical protein KVT40_003591 [Elsinoe batatas]|uniref:Alcohol dehydrogenase-like C-terminal domain-containing protein n=1 Tax=Elsinoe batatas TaxID=2601811 RepID=A0A8K0PHR3_9PEZI|nr:hypothetical protein KVT40_003591 [Elsinoe batatas]
MKVDITTTRIKHVGHLWVQCCQTPISRPPAPSPLALQLAKAAGAKTIITSSSDEKLQFVTKKYGANYTINYKTNPNWSEKVLECTKGEGADYVINNAGVPTVEQSINSVKTGTGIVALVGALTGMAHDKIPNVPLQTLMKSCVLRGIYVGPRTMLEDLVKVVAAHDLEMPVDQVFKFD